MARVTGSWERLCLVEHLARQLCQFAKISGIEPDALYSELFPQFTLQLNDFSDPGKRIVRVDQKRRVGNGGCKGGKGAA